MKRVLNNMCLGWVILGILVLSSPPASAIPQYDSLVFYQNSTVIGILEAVNPGQFYFVDDPGVANPYTVHAVILYPFGADLNAPFVVDIFGVVLMQNPSDPLLEDPYLFLVSDLLMTSLDLNNPPPGTTPVPDTQMTYDSTGFLNPALVQLGITLQFEHGVKSASVPDATSTLSLLSLAFGGIIGLLRRRK